MNIALYKDLLYNAVVYLPNIYLDEALRFSMLESQRI